MRDFLLQTINIMFKLTLPTPIKLNKEQIADISWRATVTTNSEWLVTELENDDLYILSSAVDTLYCYMESEWYFNSKWEFVWV